MMDFYVTQKNVTFLSYMCSDLHSRSEIEIIIWTVLHASIWVSNNTWEIFETFVLFYYGKVLSWNN